MKATAITTTPALPHKGEGEERRSSRLLAYALVAAFFRRR